MTEIACPYAGAAWEHTPFSLRRFLRVTLSGCHLVILSTILCALAGLLFLRLMPPTFTASMVVGPMARSGSAAMGPRQPGAEARIAVSLAEFGNADEQLSDFRRYLSLLGSVPVAEQVMGRPDLLVRLFPDRWDAVTQTWRQPTSIGGKLRSLVHLAAGRALWIEPDAVVVAETLGRALAVMPVGQGPLHRIVFRHADRATALAVLRLVSVAADQRLRREALRRSAAGIAHIRGRLDDTIDIDHEAALGNLLAEYERAAMMTELDLPFAADPLQPPHAKRFPDWPDPVTVLGLAAALGLVLGFLSIVLRAAWTAGKQEPG